MQLVVKAAGCEEASSNRQQAGLQPLTMKLPAMDVLEMLDPRLSLNQLSEVHTPERLAKAHEHDQNIDNDVHDIYDIYDISPDNGDEGDSEGEDERHNGANMLEDRLRATSCIYAMLVAPIL